MDAVTFQKFIGEANRCHQQLCVWRNTHNNFVQHCNRWNEWGDKNMFAIENFTKRNGAKYKNFWSVTNASLQHGWILGVARLFDPAFHSSDKKKLKPRISLDYILLGLNDRELAEQLSKQIDSHLPVIKSVKSQRNNVLAHKDLKFESVTIEAGVEILFEWLEQVIAKIKQSETNLQNCGVINVEYNEKLSKCGVDEVFETLILGESS